MLLSGCTGGSAAPPPSAATLPVTQNVTTAPPQTDASLDSLPAFLSETPWVEINGNEPYFTEADYTTDPFETYAELDSLGRCGVAYANICQELMPTEERGNIGSVKPSGWQSVKYSTVDGGYLYNRCHLIGFQLAGENANKQNLITGTRYLNIEGMLPFENMVADYVKETDSHVLYRVTPIYTGNNLVANGVLLEGYSVEDEGDGICFCVYAYNAQPGIAIDYATGESWEDAAVGTGASPSAPSAAETTYILNTSSKKFHLPDCGSTEKISAGNKETYTGTREDLVAQGYEPCGACKP
ncbi:MAG: DNA/RNA non-specific endonuclease [Oscillospiraceae bacterium]|nr:DNA/RNA non-specific endonuclease [Oscillospiraceae bacterium]